MDLTSSLLLGLQSASQPVTLLYCFIGVFLGTLVGVLPGIGALAAISLLLPIIYHIPPMAAIVMLAGVYYGAQYGGSTASILLNLPGTPASAVTCLDGYPMTKQGKAGIALFMTTVASFVGSMLGILVLILFAPGIVELGFQFGSAEYFSVMLLGLVAASTLATGSVLKGFAMIVFGLLLGTIGTDINSGVPRFVFGMPELMDGLNLVALAMGIFAIAEIIKTANEKSDSLTPTKITLRSMMPTAEDSKRSIMPMLRGTSIGSFFGALPGTGASIAAFMAYAFEKKMAEDSSRFGQGAIEGVVAPEAANNAAAQTAFVPTLLLGIPGDAVMALVLAALIVHGIQPGPSLITDQPELFWGLIVSFGIGNIMLVLLNLPLIGIWVSILRIPYRVLYPIILVFVMLGVYSVNNNTFDIFIVAALGIMGYVLAVLKFQAAPLLLGFVLGPLIEEHLRRALLLSRGDMMTFIDRPISAGFLAVAATLILFAIFRSLRAKC